MNNPIQIIEAAFLTVGDIISWEGRAAMIGGYRPTRMRPRLFSGGADREEGAVGESAVELTLVANSDLDNQENVVVLLTEKIRVLVPYRN